jgi:hypothetical protein
MYNFDVNIWDKVGYFTNYEQEGWTLTPHFIVLDKEGYESTGDMIDVINLHLTKEEAESLTLGLDREEGGDYSGDQDFFLDFHGFFDVYKNIPDIVTTYLHYVRKLISIRECFSCNKEMDIEAGECHKMTGSTDNPVSYYCDSCAQADFDHHSEMMIA